MSSMPTSFLDGLPRSAEEARKMLELTRPMVERFFASIDLTPRQQSILDLLNKGVPLADIYGLTQDERDAMFAKGCELVQAGEIEKGRDWLMFVYQLDPFDARVIYVIAVTYQTEGNFTVAAKLYICFLAHDATNPEGYLRLGECLLAARDYGTAADCFKFARTQCERGKGDAAAAEYAEKPTRWTSTSRMAAHGSRANIRNEGNITWLTQPIPLHRPQHRLPQKPTPCRQPARSIRRRLPARSPQAWSRRGWSEPWLVQ
jgi:tetratricopeptide (TPR) repeat protein